MKYQVIIIGGGPAGYTAAEAAAKGGLSVLLIEKNSLGVAWRNVLPVAIPCVRPGMRCALSIC
jgi:thioredoxin reductase